MIDCEIAEITINVGDDQTHFDVPAFTRTKPEIERIVRERVDMYFMSGGGKSIADFAMYLLAEATNEPRQQEEGSDK